MLNVRETKPELLDNLARFREKPEVPESWKSI